MQKVLRSVFSSAWSSARRLARSSICLILAVWLLTVPVWSETSALSEPDWPELMSYLEEIRAGLNMTDLPFSEIGNYFSSESDRLNEEKTELQSEKQRLQQEKNNLEKRESGLNAREQDLDARQSLYDGMQKDLQVANDDLKRMKKWGWIITALAAVAAGLGGYKIGKEVSR
jgi:LPS O-antigen subunit length determinant protein (WzzB/FepE family)